MEFPNPDDETFGLTFYKNPRGKSPVPMGFLYVIVL